MWNSLISELFTVCRLWIFDKVFYWYLWGMKLNWNSKLVQIGRIFSLKVEFNLAQICWKTLNTVTRFAEELQTSQLTSKYFVIYDWIIQLSNFTEIILLRITKQTLYSSLCLHSVQNGGKVFSYIYHLGRNSKVGTVIFKN